VRRAAARTAPGEPFRFWKIIQAYEEATGTLTGCD
jgi:hypothetical protein